MPTTIEAIQAEIEAAATPGFRGRLIARGQARAMIWRDGALPADAPAFSPQLSYDLHSYGYSLLGLGLRLRDLGGDPARARIAFEQAATALEAVMAKGNRGDSDRDFHFVMAAAAYHLARLSARAYSLLVIVLGESNFSPIERAIAQLMLRDFNALDDLVMSFRAYGTGSDERITAAFEAYLNQDEPQAADGADSEHSSFILDGIDLALTDNFLAAMSIFRAALEHGEQALVNEALTRLREGQNICGELNLLPQWWAHRVAIHLLSDLWDSTFHVRLPANPSGGSAPLWPSLRELFIASLMRRPRAEVDLWPSQIDAAVRAVNQTDDLVVSLPTSAGKTRIAELCILRCLASGKRVVFITPLRALSAQTETALQRTFFPLGRTISALYGSVGVSGLDEDAIRERHIVVATPEKIDFALRNDPSLLDDVGLLVFDEGHMIGPGEREVRYEVQIQRLLKRSDASQRRIVCLSAILPDGDQLEDFANWLRRDQPGGLVKNDWRPTRLRYGEVTWNGQTALLSLRVGEERPFVPRFLTAFTPPLFIRPKRQRTRVFPDDQRELCLATAWRLVEDGQTILIFCPERRSVEPFAEVIIDLHERGALKSLLTIEPSKLATALALGQEWLGQGHAILRCLELGVALHHGALPTAYRKEVERLLREGVLKVTISSPTLAQGLNLSATVVIMHSLFRRGELIEISEFKNVIGRAGRAYIDVEGLVLYPVFDGDPYHLSQWDRLITNLGSREMESGLVRLVLELLVRMHNRTGGTLQQLADYVVNNPAAWTFPEIPNEKPQIREHAFLSWQRNLATLDTAILSLIGENDIPDHSVEETLDRILQSSLWERSLKRRPQDHQLVLKTAFVARSKVIWAQSTSVRRRGYFLAGIGLESGLALDAIAAECNELLVTANNAIFAFEAEDAIAAITSIAERVFSFYPFAPDPMPPNWRAILRCWLLGEPLAAVAADQESDTLQFVEGGLVYRLPWAMEAIRVRGIANGDIIDDTFGLRLEDYDLRFAVCAVETGTLNRSASILIQAGFNSRIAAIKVVNDTGATFSTAAELNQWLGSEVVAAWSALPDWPTPETQVMWATFSRDFVPHEGNTWTSRRYWASVAWNSSTAPRSGTPVRLFHLDGRPAVLSVDGLPIGTLKAPLNPNRRGLLRGVVGDEAGKILLTYLGPEDLWLKNIA
ncbi:DEAD/DEAH box helicase (plasmid) [Rhodovastum atsumiense]|uniref:DEAD/DEAH box helicase n=1 Tax=Rhodovastum atsumiense TaxID=504468 RepID=A0A5M6IMY1_9PROT|nr:DEAD/DEAH box helicase [Rhodovastum atsumiense]KAA5609611.1 DEAD/DEAH box helicase [Rhodovastum atsumiense]CAH2606384.1 DEAD/DEAH box helicase [Rhodovastum atsumiense]